PRVLQRVQAPRQQTLRRCRAARFGYRLPLPRLDLLAERTPGRHTERRRGGGLRSIGVRAARRGPGDLEWVRVRQPVGEPTAAGGAARPLEGLPALLHRTTALELAGRLRGRGELEDSPRELQRVSALPESASRTGQADSDLSQGF